MTYWSKNINVSRSTVTWPWHQHHQLLKKCPSLDTIDCKKKNSDKKYHLNADTYWLTFSIVKALLQIKQADRGLKTLIFDIM